MRTIVAFILLAFPVAAQLPEVERLGKRVADNPSNVADRQALLRAVMQPGVPVEKARSVRRAQVLWMIENQPTLKILDDPLTQLSAKGRLSDPDGFARASQLWKDQAGKPGAPAKTIANAAAFFKTSDPAQGFAILDSAERDQPKDGELARARGILDAALVTGISGLDDNAFARYTTSAARRQAPEAARALKEIEASQDAHLIGGAGEFLSRNNAIVIPFNVTFGDDDIPALAEKWLRRAHSLEPSAEEWNLPLSNAIRTRAQRTNDPVEKLRLLREAAGLLPENQRVNQLAEIAQAEFEANDDVGAERDGHALSDKPRNAYEYHIGQTVLGRLAMEQGKTAEAKERLLASVKFQVPLKGQTVQPNMKLAQEILDTGDRDTVVAFLEALRIVWTFDQGRIDHMVNFVKRSSSPLDLQQMSFQIPGNDFRNKPAPAFDVKDRSGKGWTQEQLAGKTVALVFGSGPGIEKLSKDFAPRGVEFFQSAATREDPLARKFEVESDPTLVVIDRAGRVVSYFPGKTNEAAWRREIEMGISGRPSNSNPNHVDVPEPKGSTAPMGNKATLAWGEVDHAESYLVEWDSRDEKGWVFDRDHTVSVIPTRNTSVTLDLTGFIRIRWRVLAVPRFGQGGAASAWQEIEGVSVTKIYK